jgi:hypothetical protein
LRAGDSFPGGRIRRLGCLGSIRIFFSEFVAEDHLDGRIADPKCLHAAKGRVRKADLNADLGQV